MIYMTVTVLPKPGQPEMSKFKLASTQTSVGDLFEKWAVDELKDHLFFFIAIDDFSGFVGKSQFIFKWVLREGE